MAHTANPISMRTMSLSVSALLWGAALFAAVSIGPKIVAVLPPPDGDPPIVVISVPSPVVPPATVVPRTARTPADTTIPLATVAPPAELGALGADSGGDATGLQLTPPPPVVTRPHWLRTPGGDELTRYYPERALARGKSGEASLACLVRTDGTLACLVAAETPPGWGFGDAALRMSRSYQMEPALRDGVPIEARYTLRVPFELH